MATCTKSVNVGEKSYLLTLEGSFAGDIGINDFEGKIKIALKSDPKNLLFQATVEPFTHNCGIKALSYVVIRSGDIAVQAELLHIAEAAIYYACRCGILIGSDFIGGNTYIIVKNSGKDWVFTDPVWNPNYTWSKAHKISLFRKHLEAQLFKDIPNKWEDVCAIYE